MQLPKMARYCFVGRERLYERERDRGGERVNEQGGGCQPLSNFKCKCKLKYWPRCLLSGPDRERATTACPLLRCICILSGRDPITPPLHRVSRTLPASRRRRRRRRRRHRAIRPRSIWIVRYLHDRAADGAKIRK